MGPVFPETASPPNHPLPQGPTPNAGQGPGGRRSAGVSHHGEGATFEWERHKSHTGPTFSHRSKKSVAPHSTPQVTGPRGEAISPRETDVKVLPPSPRSDLMSRARSNALKKQASKSCSAEVRDGTIFLIRYFKHRCINSKFPAGIFPVQFQVTAKGGYHVPHKNENYT